MTLPTCGRSTRRRENPLSNIVTVKASLDNGNDRVNLTDAMLSLARDGHWLQMTIRSRSTIIEFYIDCTKFIPMLAKFTQDVLEAVMWYRDNGRETTSKSD